MTMTRVTPHDRDRTRKVLRIVTALLAAGALSGTGFLTALTAAQAHRQRPVSQNPGRTSRAGPAAATTTAAPLTAGSTEPAAPSGTAASAAPSGAGTTPAVPGTAPPPRRTTARPSNLS